MSTRFYSYLLVVGAAVAGGAIARPAAAQTPAAAAQSPDRTKNPFAADGTKRVPISKAVFGDAGIIVNARDDGFIEVAAAGPQKTLLLQLRTLAARAWVDSTARMLRAKLRRSDTLRTYRSEIQEYGTNSVMAVTRKPNAGESAYALFFTDAPTGGFTIPIEASEADVFVAIVRKAVVQSAKMLDKPDTTAAHRDSTQADSAPPAPKKKRPTVKKPVTTPPAPAKPNP